VHGLLLDFYFPDQNPIPDGNGSGRDWVNVTGIGAIISFCNRFRLPLILIPIFCGDMGIPSCTDLRPSPVTLVARMSRSRLAEDLN